jgi:tetratricopeptide (TPR) repeat protein
LIFLLLCSLGAMGQWASNAPLYHQQDDNSMYSGKYAWNLSRIINTMKWIDNNRRGATDSVFVSVMDTAYRKLKGYRDSPVNYCLLDKQLDLINSKLDKAWNDSYQRSTLYGLVRKEILSRKPDETDRLILDGIGFREENKPDKAYQCFKKAVEKDSTRLNYYFFVIMDEVEYTGDTARALDYLNKVINRSNGMKITTFDPYLTRAWIYLLQKQYSPATTDLKRALKNDSTNLHALSIRGYIKSQLKDYTGSNADYQQMLKWLQFKTFSVTADSAQVLNGIGWNYYLLKEYELCAEYACKSLLIRPDDSHTLDTRGSGYYGLGEYERCIDDMTKAIGSNAELANSWYLRGMSYLKLNRLERACSDLSKAALLGVAEAAEAMKGLCQPPTNAEVEKQRQFPNKKLPNVKNRFRIEPNGNMYIRL